ncbi:unnamed protein product [Meloidogyne enterolobii]|uniref:Uncharacterized protein n=1 Tax=Meloidogyne enterolobii TaxID=390850 RepID=A0ACB1ABK7_MELEN
MKINFRRYLFMVLITLILALLYIIDEILFFMPYSKGGIKDFDNFNMTWPFIQYKMEKITLLTSLPVDIFQILPYLIALVCAFKMIRFVNLNSNFNGNVKKLNKLITKVMLIMVVVPFINQAGIIFILSISKTNNNTTNMFRVLFGISFHLTPVFNPIICILTNTPYRKAFFNSLRIHPQ